MKYILTFLFGAGVGFGGCLLYLRPKIKREMEEIEARQACEKASELPFEDANTETSSKDAKAVRSDSGASESSTEAPYSGKVTVGNFSGKVDYHKVSVAAMKGSKLPDGPGVPVLPREDTASDVTNYSEFPEGAEPISKDDFEYDTRFSSEYLVFFRSENILARDDGVIINEPAVMLGSGWEQHIGIYEPEVAYIRNARFGEDYRVAVRPDSYEDVFGAPPSSVSEESW